MFTCTNLAWADDPYRTGQQLYKRPSPMLAAFTVLSAGQRAVTAPAAIAVGYLLLHRTRAIEVTEDTVSFGFRAASTAGDGGVRDLVRIADLDLMQARRHARFLAGHALADGLRSLREAEPGRAACGLAAVEAAWADRRSRRRGTAAMIDIGEGHRDLAAICRGAAITASPASMAREFSCPAEPGAAEQLAAAAAEQALVIALACARALGRYRWEGTLRTARVMTATAWDLFPHVAWHHTRREQPAS
jgi:hypothetical protein